MSNNPASLCSPGAVDATVLCTLVPAVFVRLLLVALQTLCVHGLTADPILEPCCVLVEYGLCLHVTYYACNTIKCQEGSARFVEQLRGSGQFSSVSPVFSHLRVNKINNLAHLKHWFSGVWHDQHKISPHFLSEIMGVPCATSWLPFISYRTNK